MNRRLVSILLIGLHITAGLARAGEVPTLPPPELLSHASEDQYWISQTLPPPRGATLGRSAVRARQRASNRPWERVALLSGRAVDLAHRGSNAAVLLDDGTWLLAWPGGSSTGRAPPGSARLRALAGDGATLWAVVAAIPTELEESTRPATQPLEPAAPNDRRRLLLCTFEDGRWLPRGELPETAAPNAAVSCTIHAGKPIVAVLTAWRKVIVFRRTDDGWETDSIETGFDIRAFKLLEETPAPTLWLAGERGAGELRLFRGMWGAPIPLQAGEELASAVARAACYFSGNVRVTWIDGTRLRERAFSTAGAPVGDAIDLGAFPPAPAAPLGSGTLLLLGVLGALLALNILRAEEETELAFGQSTVRLATLPRRLIAGSIDLLPMFMIIVWKLPLSDTTAAAEVVRNPSFLVWLVIGAALYLLHTTIGEMWGGNRWASMRASFG